MKILSFDVSTTATGCVIYDQETKIHEAKLFPATGKVPYERIRTIAKDVKEWIKGKEFDMVLITKASYSQMSPNILQLEGILLAIAVDRDIPFDYYPDISWYRLIGQARDERPTKKKKSVERYVNFHNYKVIDQKVKMSGSKLDKISVLVEEPLRKGFETSKFWWVSDDIADSWNAANLFEVRQRKDKLKFEKTQTQEEINKLRKLNQKLRGKLELGHRDLSFIQAEIVKFKKEYELTGSKVKLNSQLNRESKEEIKFSDLVLIKSDIMKNEDKIKELMQKKNNL